MAQGRSARHVRKMDTSAKATLFQRSRRSRDWAEGKTPTWIRARRKILSVQSCPRPKHHRDVARPRRHHPWSVGVVVQATRQTRSALAPSQQSLRVPVQRWSWNSHDRIILAACCVRLMRMTTRVRTTRSTLSFLMLPFRHLTQSPSRASPRALLSLLWAHGHRAWLQADGRVRTRTSNQHRSILRSPK